MSDDHSRNDTEPEVDVKPLTQDEFSPLPDMRDRRRAALVAWSALRLVWRASPRQLLATFVLQLAAGAALGGQLLVAREVLQQLTAIAGGRSETTDLMPAFAALVVLMAANGTIAALMQQQQQLLTEYVTKHTFDRIIGVSTSVDLEYFETPTFYDQLDRARTSGLVRSIDMVTSVSTLITGLLTSAGIAAALLWLEPILLVLVLLAAGPVLLATIFNSREGYIFEYGMTPNSRERMYLMELLTERDAAKEVRVFGATDFLRGRYDQLTNERFVALRAFLRRRVRVALVGMVGGAVAIAAVLFTLATLISDGRIDLATAVTAGIAIQQLNSRLIGITQSVGRLIESSMFIDDYEKFLSLVPEETREAAEKRALPPAERPEPAQPAAPGGPAEPFRGLRVEGASFTYPSTDALVLDDVDLEVRPGEIVALVGENGSGKTTLVKLICQLYTPQAGRVLWNGKDTRDIPRDVIRDDMTVLFQDFIQYHLTARENIELGRVEKAVDEELVIEAARIAGAHRLIERLPDDYETRLGRQFYGGHELSLGQWQRLALARAFYRGGSFLVLDEPTASLDPRAEHDLFAQMRLLSEGRSVLLVSHRFSSVRTADRIYVLQHGRVTEVGSHEELMAVGGHYAELFSLQAHAYLGKEPSPA